MEISEPAVSKDEKPKEKEENWPERYYNPINRQATYMPSNVVDIRI